jgi:CDP-diacylglycerol pyrophosphatase
MKPAARAPTRTLLGAATLIAVAVLSPTWAADRDALLHIVQGQCLVHWRQTRDPAPCERVVLSGTPSDYAVLHDRKGGAHFLVIPTRTITGMEDPQLLRPDTPNYFAAAWQARDQLNTVMGHAPKRDSIGLAINSARARGQDQLHIHISCLRPGIYRDLQTAVASSGAKLSDQWAPLPIGGSIYMALRIPGQDVDQTNPIQLLAQRLPGARQNMGDYTILLAGAQFADGPGFIVLTGRTPTRAAVLLGAPGKGLVAPGETLLDANCAIDH